MTWLQPQWLILAWAVLPLGVLVGVATWAYRRKLDRAFGPELARRVLPRSTRRRRTVRDLLFLVGLALLCVALAEPAFDKELVTVRAEGVDAVFAVDLSRSMDAEDVDPSRLERARREIQDLLQLMAGDRVGVVFFAGEAVARLPLTEDAKAVAWVLGEADTAVFRAQGSAVGKALDRAMDLLGRDQGQAGKVVVLFSDGETHDPEDALRAAREAAEAGIVVYTVAIGERPSPIPTRDGGELIHRGERVMSVPDFATLEEVARVTGGATVKSIPAASDMEGLYREIRSTVRAVQRETQQAESWRSAYQTPLLAGLLCWFVGVWLGDGVRRYGAASVVLLGLAMPSAHGAPVALVDADRAYRQGDFIRAERLLEELAVERAEDPGVWERLGAARYRAGDWTGAARAFERASALRGGDADALYNAGNARYRAGQLETALERFDRALALLPDHGPAARNRQLVAGELEARRAEQPPPPPEPSQGGDDEERGGSGEQEPQEPTEGDQQGDEQQAGQGEGEEQPRDQHSEDGSADAGEQPQQQDGSDGSDGGDPRDGDGRSEGVEPDELDGDGGEGGDDRSSAHATAGESGMGEADGRITPAQAERMLDAVEEGRQRVQYVGRQEERPW